MSSSQEPSAQVHVTSLRGRGGVLRIAGRLDPGDPGDPGATVAAARLVLTARDRDWHLEAPLELGHEHRFRVTLDWRTLWDAGPPAADILDAWVLIDSVPDGAGAGAVRPLRVRVGMTPYLVRRLSRPTSVTVGDASATITPYYTNRAQNTSFRVEVFDAQTWTYLRRRLRTRHLDRLVHRARGENPIWLVGEQPYKAQDTGLAMFSHLRANHPEIDAFYVMDPASPEHANVAALGHVLAHGSKEHVRASLLAERIVGSHHPEFLYPSRLPRFRRAIRAPRVFLQHGVMAIKPMVETYGRDAPDFDTDLFIVSSEREKSYIVGDFGYAPDEVAVTGLTRFDSLFAGDVPVRRQLLIMPTWRTWLLDEQTYRESDYHATWSALLDSPRLHELAERHDLEIVFCQHPNMRAFTARFAGTPARIVSQGDVDVQHLLKESAVLVTDFSSVGFDFAFLGKPVVYFQYDRARVLGRTGAHIDLDTELPGPVALTVDQVVDRLAELADAGFAQPEAMRHRADRFVLARDRDSSERVVAAVQRARRRRWQPDRLLAQPVPQGLYRKWRRSRFYFGHMRVLLRVLRRLPADPNRIVFEAGLGRQYADSPRAIYEELVRREHPARKIWAYGGKIHTDDPRTTVVDRLSVAYFWHLGRARYWVNSQNWPYYVTRRDDGVFVQTWHGTPLKRMLRDVAETHGRDDGYVERMLRAAAQWSVLVSPSPFATESITGAYGYSGDVLEVGYPRNDLLAGPGRDETAAVVRARLGIPAGARVVLYAPTFRDDQSHGRGKFGFALPFDPARVTRELGPDVVLLLRLHVLVSDQLDIPDAVSSTVRDVSAYPEMQELLVASDVLVTDYSSVFFDYAILRRPMIFHAYDLADYRERLRGFYLDYESTVPGPITTTEDELLTALRDVDAVHARYAPRYDEFLARFAPHADGHAAARVVDAVFGTHR